MKLQARMSVMVMAGLAVELGACSGTVGSVPPSPTPITVPVSAALNSDLQQYLRERKVPEHISAASLSVSLADHSIIDTAAGTVVYSGGNAAKPSDLYQIGSNTKAFTAIATLKLQSAGKLTRQQTIGDWLPQYSTWNAISITQLLDMTSGITTYDSTPAWEKDYSSDPYHFFSAQQLIGYIDPKSPLHKKWYYSNTGYILTQLILEKVTHLPYTQIVCQDVISPTGISDLYYYPGIYPKQLLRRTVGGYYFNDTSGDDGLLPLLKKNVRGYSISWAQSAGGVVATMHALALWARDLYQGNIVTPSERAQLQQLVSTKTGKPIKQVTPSDPRGFGLGVTEVYHPGLGRFWFYEGETLGYRAVHAYFPKQNVVIAVGLNSQPRPDQDRIGDLVASIIRTLQHYGLFK